MSGREVTACDGCGKSMRPARATPAEYPGTLARANRTTCTTCYGRVRRAQVCTDTIGDCLECGLPMVAAGRKPAAGMMRHREKGVCCECYNAASKASKASDRAQETLSLDVPLDQITDPQVRHNRQGLESLLRARRERKARAAA